MVPMREEPQNGEDRRPDLADQPRMSPRYIKPLNDEDWKRLVENLKRGPTPKHREDMANALRLAKRVKMVDADGR